MAASLGQRRDALHIRNINSVVSSTDALARNSVGRCGDALKLGARAASLRAATHCPDAGGKCTLTSMVTGA
jgi:hypothetical protein